MLLSSCYVNNSVNNGIKNGFPTTVGKSIRANALMFKKYDYYY